MFAQGHRHIWLEEWSGLSEFQPGASHGKLSVSYLGLQSSGQARCQARWQGLGAWLGGRAPA